MFEGQLKNVWFRPGQIKQGLAFRMKYSESDKSGREAAATRAYKSRLPSVLKSFPRYQDLSTRGSPGRVLHIDQPDPSVLNTCGM
jgi:hypothetical protein